MTRVSGEVEFEFLDDGGAGTFVATGKVVPQITTLLAKGQVEEAMHLYESGDQSMGQLLLEQIGTLSSQSLKNLGAMFEMARDFSSAAKVFEHGKRFGDAAKMYEKGGDYAAAAKCYTLINEHAQAAATWERAGKPELALEAYQKLGPSEAMAACMVRQHLYWDASRLYQHLGNVRAEVEALRLVPVTSRHRVAAVKRLGDLLEQHGHIGPAVQLMVETLQQVQAAQGDPELIASLIRRLETMGRFDQAQRVRGFAQKQLSSQPVVDAAKAPPPSAPQPPPSAPAAQRPSAPAANPFGPSPSAPAAAAPAPAPAPKPAAGAVDPFASLVDPFGSNAPAAPTMPMPGGGSGAPKAAKQAAPAAPANDGYGQLKAIPIFGELSFPDMKDLFRISEPTQYAAGFTIIEQDVQGHGLVVILAGNIQVVRVDKGSTTPLATLGPNAYVGELSLVDDAPTSARVVAQTPVRALVITKERFQQFLYTHEQATARIYAVFTKTLAERLRQANKRS